MDNKKLNKKDIIVRSILIILVITLFCLSMIVGNYSGIKIYSVVKILFTKLFGIENEYSTTINGIVINIRLPRTIAALIIGASLSASGCIFQELFQNELSSPDVLGVSSGSCVGASIAIILEYSAILIQLISFTFGIITIILTVLLSLVFRKNSISILLSGILITGLMTSILSYIKIKANPETSLQSIVYWTMGSISSIEMKQILFAIIPMTISIVVMFFLRWRVNFLKLEKKEAISNGVNINLLKIICIICATLLTSSAVSIAGTIGWIGLAIPHLTRLIKGHNFKKYYVDTLLMGSSFLLLVDIIGRLSSKAEIPLSVFSGFIGITIFFICIIIRRKKEHGTSY